MATKMVVTRTLASTEIPWLAAAELEALLQKVRSPLPNETKEKP